MTKSLIEDGLASSLYEQLSHERYNASLYLFIAGDLKNRGFDNLAKHFEEQHDEEISHSLIIYNLLTDLNAPVKILEINEVSLSINNIMDIATAYLEREILTTQSLNEIKKQAIEEENCVVEECMRGMIVKQQAEYEEATGFSDHAELMNGDWFKVLLWDLGSK